MTAYRFIRKIGAPLSVCALACGVAASAMAQAPGGLTAGAGKATIDIPAAALPNAEGFAVEHDKLAARVLVLDNGQARVALAVIDQTSIFEGALNQMKQDIARIDGVDPANVWVVASHTFSAPHMGGARPAENPTPEQQAEARKASLYATAVQAAVTRAAEQAKTLRPAGLGFGRGASSVNVNRNILAADGWWLGADDVGPSDKSVGVLKIEDAQHKPIAVLVNYAVQSSIMDHSIVAEGGQKAITADLGGAAVRHVESQYRDGAVAMFLVGAAGDQAPAYAAIRNVMDKDGKQRAVDLGAAAYPLIDLLGERLGAEAVRVAQATNTGQGAIALKVVSGKVSLDAQQRPRSLGDLHPSKAYVYNLNGKADAPYFVMQIGDVAVVGVQVELSSSTGLEIKRRSPFKNTIVVTMVNGAAKYLPDAESYKRFTYEAMNSSYGPGGAEVLRDSILQTLDALRKGGAK
jgi:neutral ceramidase